MQILKTKTDLDDYVKKKPLPPRIYKELSTCIGQVQELIQSGFQEMKACVILTDSDKKLELIYKRYGLSDTTLECKDTFKSGGISWVKQVHVIDDSGDGIIIFQKLETCP